MDSGTVVHIFGLSDIGNRRLNNEDAWWAGQIGGRFASMETVAEALTVACSPAPVLMLVSDGVGGASAGEVASQMAANLVSMELAARPDALASESSARTALLAALRAADAAIKKKSAEPGFDGMGATISLLCFVDRGIAWWGQAGDSRIYLCRGGRLRQISHDHSPVGRMRQEGKISEEEARRHPLRNQIDQSLGDPLNPFSPDVESLEIQAGDVFLLCSDGLTDGLWEREIEQALAAVRKAADVQPAVENLVATSKQASGRDNLTAVVGLVEFAVVGAGREAGASLGQKVRRWFDGVVHRPVSFVSRRIRPASLASFGHVLAVLPLAATIGSLSGCIVAGAVQGVGKVAVATVSTAGQVAGAAVKAAGHVAAATVDASSEVADSSLKAAAKLSKEGMVVFFDPKSGAVWQAPWTEGLKLLAASQTANVDTALQVARVIRGAQVVAAEKQAVAGLLLKSGDVVELARAAGS